MSEPVRRALPPSVFARLADATRYVITGVSPDTWFGPLQPLAPMAPPEVKGRQWDYPFGANLNYIPRSDDGVSFAELRGLADALPLLRAVIETRKDQIAAQSYAIRSRNREDSPASSQAIDQVTRFFARPDRRRSFADWLRMLLEEMLVIDAATLYPRYNRGGSLYALDIIDGSTIKPLIGEDGRAPEPPDPGLPADPQGHPGGRLLGRGAPLSAAQPARPSALWHEPGRADRAHRQHRAEARRLDPRLLPRRLLARRFRHFAEGMDGRPDPLVPGLFRRADERQSGAPAPDQVHARRLQADRGPPAAAEGPVRRVAGAHHLLRLLGPRLAVRQPGQPRDRRDHAPAGDAGRARAAESLGQERARPCDPGVHERAGARIRVGRRRRGRSARAGADAQILVGAGIKTREEARADLGLAPAGEQRRLRPTDPVVSAEAPPRASADPSVSGA